jgi:Superinfection immunity protein
VVLTHPIFPTLSDAPPAAPVVALVVYLAPSVVALIVNRERSRPVVAINLLLGWTLIGWALGLWMALERYRSSQLPRQARATAPPTAPATDMGDALRVDARR